MYMPPTLANLTDITSPTRTLVRMAVRPSPVVIQCLIRTNMVGTVDDECIPLSFIAVPGFTPIGSLSAAQYGYTIELRDADGNRESMMCQGIHNGSYPAIEVTVGAPNVAEDQTIYFYNALNQERFHAQIAFINADNISPVTFYYALYNISNMTEWALVDNTWTFYNGVSSTPIVTRYSSRSFQDGLSVLPHGFNLAGGYYVKMYAERRLWQKFSDVVIRLPFIPSSPRIDERLRQAVFLERTSDVACYVDATLVPELNGIPDQDHYGMAFPSGIESPLEGDPIWVWYNWDNHIWYVIAGRELDSLEASEEKEFYIPDGADWMSMPIYDARQSVRKGGVEYSNQNTVPVPVPLMGSHRAAPLIGGASSVYFSDAGGWSFAGGAFTYSWSCSTGSFNNASTQKPTLTLTTTGWHEVKLSITQNGKTGYGFRYIYVYDTNSIESTQFIHQPTFRSTQTGWATTLTLLADEDSPLIKDSAFVLVWRETVTDSTAGGRLTTEIGESILMAGYITNGSIRYDPESTKLTFDVETLDTVMANTPIQPFALQHVGNASWEYQPQLNSIKALYHTLQWHCNGFELFDCYFDDSHAVNLQYFTTDPNTLLGCLQSAADTMRASIQFDQAGRLYAYMDMQFAEPPANGYTTVGNLSIWQLRNDVEFKRNPFKSVRQVRLCAEIANIGFEGASGTGAVAPVVPSYSGGSIQKYDRVFVNGGGDASVLAVRYYAMANNEFSEVRAKLMGDWSGMLSPAWPVWWTMDVTEEQSSGLFTWTARKLRVIQANYVYDPDAGVMECEAVLQPQALTMAVATSNPDCSTEIPPAQSKSTGGGGSIASGGTAAPMPTVLNSPPFLCPLKCLSTEPITYEPGSCMFAVITYTEWEMVGDMLQRDKTYTCNNATATVTETFAPSDMHGVTSDYVFYCVDPNLEACGIGTNIGFVDFEGGFPAGWPIDWLMLESSVTVTYGGQPVATSISVNQGSRTITVSFNIQGKTHGAGPWRTIQVAGTVYLV